MSEHEEKPKHEYVIVRPGGWGRISDDPDEHLVVGVEEWVRVLHKEQDAYTFVTRHNNLNAAHNKRNQLNGVGSWVIEEQPEVAVEMNGTVSWLGEKASAA